jgi:hypothetical protein
MRQKMGPKAFGIKKYRRQAYLVFGATGVIMALLVMLASKATLSAAGSLPWLSIGKVISAILIALMFFMVPQSRKIIGAVAALVGIAWLVSLGYGKWKNHEAKPAQMATVRRDILVGDKLARDSTLTLTSERSPAIKTGLGFCIEWTRRGEYAFEVMDQDGNTMVYPRVLKDGEFLEFRNAKGELSQSVRVKGGGARWPKRLEYIRVRAIDTTGVRFDITRKEAN